METATATSYDSLREKAKEAGTYLVVRTQNLRTSVEENLGQIQPDTSYIHINGNPFFWVIKKLENLAPNLKVLSLTPTMKARLGPRHTKILKEKGVRVVTGYHRPEISWDITRPRDKRYQEKKKFFENLSPEQHQKFRELLHYKILEALFVKRYLCLGNEMFRSERELGIDCGYKPSSSAAVISGMVLAVYKYLNPDLVVGKVPTRQAKAIERRLAFLKKRKLEERRASYLLRFFTREFERVGSTKTPKGQSEAFLRRYIELQKLYNSGTLERRLAKKMPRGLDVLIKRYGLDGGEFKTHAKVALTFGNVSGERVRQIEVEALTILGITTKKT